MNKAKARYNRIARFYNLMEAPSEWLVLRHWRRMLFSHVKGGRLLEIGVGTGRNLSYYPSDVDATAIDIADKMLAMAYHKAKGINVNLRLMDAQRLEFADSSFDTVVGTCVFCSIPDPVQALREIHRVLKADGQLLLLEHVRPSSPVLGALFDVLNPLTVRIMGANINRRTAENITKAGLRLETQESLSTIFRLFMGHPDK